MKRVQTSVVRPTHDDCLTCQGRSAGSICDSHNGKTTYKGFDKQCVCNCMPENDVNNRLRSCLACMTEAGVDDFKAHLDCYAAAGVGDLGQIIGVGNEICWHCPQCAVAWPANFICTCANSAGPPHDPWDIPLGG